MTLEEPNWSNFKAPYYSLKNIRDKAEEFRNTWWPSDKLPVNICDIIEFDLKLEIRPISRLRELTDIDALLLGNFEGIIVDLDNFIDDRMENRMRYSLAHEIGHFVLHREVYAKFSFKSIEEWIKFKQNIPEREYFWIEQHAYEFAGRLLVPQNTLEKDLKEVMNYGKEKGFEDFNTSNNEGKVFAKDYIASKICRKYGVSDQVIVRRLDKEGLWPQT